MIKYNTIGYILKNLNSDLTIEELSDNFGVAKSTIDRLTNRKKPHHFKRPPTSIKHDDFIEIFVKYRKEYFHNSSAEMIFAIMNLLHTEKIYDTDIERKFAEFKDKGDKYSDKEFEKFVSLILHKATLSCTDSGPDQSDDIQPDKRQPADLEEEISENNVPGIVACTYSELCQMGLSAKSISERLLENDAKLYGVDNLGANAGTIPQWAAQIEAAPDNWLFFCEGTNIIANWSFTYLSPSEEESVRKGTFFGDDYSLDSVNYPLTASDKEVTIFLLNISMNDGYQSQELWDKLWKSFGDRLYKLIQSGITIKGIYADMFREDHTAIFEQMGFEYLVDNVESGKVYYLDLTKPALENFGWIMPDLEQEDIGNLITFRQLSCEDVLKEQQLRDLAGLIYDTDKYIYPALFSSRAQAKELIPLLFASNEDNMFNLDNIYCAVVRDRIVGLILHRHGPLCWCADKLIEYANMLDLELPGTVRQVEQEYFKEYDITAPNSTAILNCCINGNYRMRSIRLGTKMMQAFVEQHSEQLELYVLQETMAAVRLYLRAGFKIQAKCNGFSTDKRELPCYFMCRPEL